MMNNSFVDDVHIKVIITKKFITEVDSIVIEGVCGLHKVLKLPNGKKLFWECHSVGDLKGNNELQTWMAIAPGPPGTPCALDRANSPANNFIFSLHFVFKSLFIYLFDNF